MIYEVPKIDNNINSSSNLHDLEICQSTINDKPLRKKNSIFQKVISKFPFLQNVSQKINSRSVKSNIIHVPDLNFPKKREIIINNIKTTIPKVNNFIGKQSFSTNKESSEVKMFQDTKPKKKPKYLKRAGLTFTGGLAMFMLFDPMIQTILNFNMQLKPKGLITKLAWTKNPIPINSCWHFFSITNAEEFLSKGDKPFLEEYGPICYDIYRVRRVLEWTEHTVKFMERFEFVFNEQDSLSRDYPLQVVNFPIVGAVLTARNLMTQFYLSFLGPIVYNAISGALRITGEDLITEISPRKLMEGWELNIVRYLDYILLPFRSIGIPLPDFKEGFLGIIDHSFSVTKSISFFEIGPFLAYTKAENGHIAGEVYQYGEYRTFPYFKAPCNKYGGSDGIIWERPLKAKEVHMYIYHLCRQLKLVYNTTHYFQGVETNRYVLDPRMFDFSLRRNRCFCTEGRDWKDCDGWSDLSSCLFGVPAGISFPHFLYYPRRLAEVDGLNPDPEKHFGFLEFETNLAVPALVRLCIQAVLDISPVSSVSALSSLPTVKLPILWVKLYAGADTPVLGTLFFVGANFLRYGSILFLFGGLGLSTLFLKREISYKKRQQ